MEKQKILTVIINDKPYRADIEIKDGVLECATISKEPDGETDFTVVFEELQDLKAFREILSETIKTIEEFQA